MDDVKLFLDSKKTILESITQSLEEKRRDEAFRKVGEYIQEIQQFILFLAQYEILSTDDVNQISNLLVQALQERDGVLLTDVIKYGLLDVTKQLLEGYSEDEE